MAKIPGLIKRGGRYSLRTYVPKDIVQSYGKREVWTALETADAGEANRRAKLKAAEFVRHFDDYRRSAARACPTVASTTKAALDLDRLSVTLAQDHFVAVKEKDTVDRAELFQVVQADHLAFFNGKVRELPDTEYWHVMVVSDGELSLTSVLSFCWWHWHGKRIEHLKSAISGGDYSEHLPIVTKHLGEQADAVKKPQRIVLAKAIMQAEVEALTDIRKGDEKRYEAISQAKRDQPVKVVPAANAIPDEENPLLSAAAPRWVAEKISAGKWRPRRADSCKRTIDLLIEIVGDKRIGDYGKSDARDFKALLCDLPPNRSKLPETRDLEVRAAARKARQLGLPKMSIVNVNKQLTIISGMFDWFAGQYEGVASNPFANATIEISTSIRDERDPFTLADLKAMFSAPIYAGCKSETSWKEPGDQVLRSSAKFWLPILGLYTGARINELCKLKVTDIRKEDGVWYFDINTEEHADAAIDARVKSAASVRRIPLHSDLVKIGFLAFVIQRRVDRAERLFPELTPDRYGKLADGFGKHFGRFLKSVGIKRDKIDFHSFRHTWTDACLNSRIPDAATLALKGKSRPGTLARYGHGKTDLEILAEEMAKLTFKGLDLSHLDVG